MIDKKRRKKENTLQQASKISLKNGMNCSLPTFNKL